MHFKKDFHRLNENFYKNASGLKEILQKENRPHTIAIFEIDKLLFAIPFRTNIRHPYSYRFKNSEITGSPGLDFSKAVLVNENDLGEKTNVNYVEFTEFDQNRVFIARRFSKFISDYKKWVESPEKYKSKQTVIKFSSLQNYHQKLGIIEPIK